MIFIAYYFISKGNDQQQYMHFVKHNLPLHVEKELLPQAVHL